MYLLHEFKKITLVKVIWCLYSPQLLQFQPLDHQTLSQYCRVREEVGAVRGDKLQDNQKDMQRYPPQCDNIFPRS